MRPVILRLCILLTIPFFIFSCNREVEFDAVLMQGPAPSEVQANIAFNNEEPPFSVTISPTAQGATAFEVLSGLPGVEAVLIGIQQSVTFIYPEADENFFVTVRAISANDMVTEQQFEVIPPADPCTQIFSAPVTWDDGNDPAFSFGFNGVELEVIPNPDPSGANPDVSNVLSITQDGGGNFDGFGVQMTGPTNFAADDKVVRLLFWSDTELPIRLTVQQDPNNETEREAEVNLIHTGTGWEELQFDFSTATAGFTGNPDGALGVADGADFVPTGEYIRFQMFISPGDDVAGTFYLDNVGICPDGGAAPPAAPVAPEPCTPLFAPLTMENGESFSQFNLAGDPTIVANPDLSGANTEASNVLEVIGGGVDFQALQYFPAESIDFSGTEQTITMLLWSQQAVDFRVNATQGVADAPEVEVSASHGGTGWEELTFDFNNATLAFNGQPNQGDAFVPTGLYDELQIYIAVQASSSETFYIDNITGGCE
ncbi:hypothetical protein ACOKFD_14240 [Flagellimonas sp. S174]|uniref:hypothetical protein n=1 Tax=Flagellimonas sp. S174 TaxID=3410790 RepID=UPI003BF4E16A